MSVLVPVLGVLLVLVSLATARRLQLSALDSLQLAPTLEVIAARGRDVIDRLYPEPWRPDASPTTPVIVAGHEVSWPSDPAVLQQIDLPRLLAVAERLGGEVQVVVGVGEVLWDAAVVARLSGAPSAADHLEVLSGFETGIERIFDQDPLLAFRLLADIGLRAVLRWTTTRIPRFSRSMRSRGCCVD